MKTHQTNRFWLSESPFVVALLRKLVSRLMKTHILIFTCSHFPLSSWAAAFFEYIFLFEMCCLWKCYTTGTLIYPYSLFIRLLFVLQYIKSKCISWACPLNTILSPTKRFGKAKEINEYFTTTKTRIFNVKKKKKSSRFTQVLCWVYFCCSIFLFI